MVSLLWVALSIARRLFALGMVLPKHAARQ